MTTRDMAARPGPILSPLRKDDIKRWIAPKASDVELEIFVRFCQAQGLNPFAKDVYLIPFRDNKASSAAGKDIYTHAIVIGLQAYLKKACRNPLYQTYQSGLIVFRAGQYVDVIGTVGYPGDELYGAWCRVWKKGSPVPFEHRITLADWDKKREMWLTNPRMMLEVRVISQGIRRAFPEETGPGDIPQQVEGITVEMAEESTIQQLGPVIAAPADETALEPGGTQQKTGGTPSASASPTPKTAPPPSERRFQSITDFWEATETAGWTKDQVTDALGGSLGTWLGVRRKEKGTPATWDDAYNFLVERFGVTEGR